MKPSSRYRSAQFAVWFCRVIALLSTSAAVAGEAKNDFDPAVDFSRFKTFCFIGGHESEKTGVLADPARRERIKNFIAGAMESRGLQEVPRDEVCSLAVRYWVGLRGKDETTIITTPSVWAGYPAYWTGPWYYSYQEYVIEHYVEGTLVVDWIDAASRELIWRTFLRQKIEDRTKAYQEAKKNLNKAFAVFPPSAEEAQKMRGQRKKLEAKYR
jgi:hypothetical protein